MEKATSAKEKAFKQISFPRDFVDAMSAQANAADRSAAKQIEHYVRIAQVVEQILPSTAVMALKAGEMQASALLTGLAAALANPGQSSAFRGTIEANPIRISQDPDVPNGVIRTNADGTKERGRLNERGEFVAGPDSQRALHKGPKNNEPPKKAQRENPKTEKRRTGTGASAHKELAHA